MTKASEQLSLGYARGSDTSKASAVSSVAIAAHRRSMVYELIVIAGDRGMTADECCERLGLTHNSIAPRLTELKRSGLIVDTERRRKTRMGRAAAVLMAVAGALTP